MRDQEYSFSVDINSKKHVKNISISDKAHDRVFFEGNLGELVSLSIMDGLLELEGNFGVVRMTMSKELLEKALTNPDSMFSLSSEVGSYKSTKKYWSKKNGKEICSHIIQYRHYVNIRDGYSALQVRGGMVRGFRRRGF